MGIYISSKQYQTGYNFQNRVKRVGEKLGYYVICQPKSSFPDQVWLSTDATPIFIECKVKNGLNIDRITLPKLISKYEREEAQKLIDKGYFFKVAFRVKPRGEVWFYEFIEKDFTIINEKKMMEGLSI